MDILALILSCGLGFGLACVVLARTLAKSNDVGNSVGKYSDYTAGINYDITRDKLSYQEIDVFVHEYITAEDREPDGRDLDAKVERQ
ncbi:MAG: hypothetical protein IJ757_08690 [Clostridiales bacterium]|nr:hypothetical protein [Clostridiales bacterium]